MINNSDSRKIWKGNGVATSCPTGFDIVDEAHVFLVLVDTDGTKTAVTSGYKIDKVEKKVLFPYYENGSSVPEEERYTVLEEGQSMIIYREVPINQLTQLSDVWPFNSISDGLDKLTMIDQQLQDGLDRSLRFDIDLAGDFDATLPIQPGFGWRVSDDGKSIVALSNPESVYNNTVSVYNAAVADTTAIKNATEAFKNTTEGYKTAAAASVVSAQGCVTNATNYANLANAWAESGTSPDGNINSKSSKSWAANAASNAADAATSANYCKALAADGAVYDASTTYEPGDATMTPEGNLWRCITQSTGENPSTSGKWVPVSVVNSNTFEPDENGDLMPLTYPKQSSQFDIDENGDIEPAL